MASPGVPGSRRTDLELPCGETIDAGGDLDMGMREYDCACGASHAVVMDVHPPSRFFPESVVRVLRGTIEAADDFEEFGTPHLLGMVMEEFPERVAVADVGEDTSAGYAMVWVTDFDSRRLHEVVVELVVELMDHAIGHADDGEGAGEFEARLAEFDAAAFVEQYRRERDFEDERDRPV